eukprot:Opistho-1_new@36400
MAIALLAPEPLSAEHVLDGFFCGEPVLDEWLKRRALANQASRASRTFVVTNPNRQVMGYYALATGAVAHVDATAGVRRTMPAPIPILVLGRLAVDQRAQGMKLGVALLKDAVNRSMAVSQNAGVRALLVHAHNERAKDFYLKYGFSVSPTDAMTLMLRLPG